MAESSTRSTDRPKEGFEFFGELESGFESLAFDGIVELD